MRWIRLLDRQEVWLRRLFVLGLVFILILQVLSVQNNLKTKTTVQPSSKAVSGNLYSLVDLDLVDANLETQRITVLVNGTTIGQFSGPSMRITLHQGDIVTINTSGVASAIHVTVDHDDPKLFYPAPGYTISVDDGHPYTFDKVEFVQP
jgi:archaellum component FlaF (FlaF/FlaG flagellin family)